MGAVRMGSGGGRGEARAGGEAPGGHAGQASGRQRALLRERPTGWRGRLGDAEGGADARARARGRERGGRQVGPGGGEKRKGNGSTCKFKNMHFPGSKIHQILLKQDHTTKNIMQ
jgi:hypothetical protein